MSDAVIELTLRELALQELQLEDKHRERQLKQAALSATADSEPSGFDVVKNIRLGPPFVEKDVEKYFTHFEHVATISVWPKHSWTLLLQSVLIGKAQAYSALSRQQDSKTYETVNSAI